MGQHEHKITNISYAARRDAYKKASELLDRYFQRIEKIPDLFFTHIGGWVWHRHDNLRKTTLHLFERTLNKEPSFSPPRHSFIKSLAKALWLLAKRGARFRPASRTSSHEPEGLFFLNTHLPNRLGLLHHYVTTNFRTLTFHLKDQPSLATRHHGFSVYSYITTGCILKALTKTAVLCLLPKSPKQKNYLFTPSPSDVFNSTLHYYCTARTLLRLRPKFVITSVSLNHPHGRRLFQAAGWARVPTINVIQKPFGPCSIPFLAGITPESLGLPTSIICYNEHQKKQLLARGLDNEKLYVGYKYPTPASQNGVGQTPTHSRSAVSPFIRTIIIALGVEPQANYFLLNLLAEHRFSQSPSLIIKPHPLLPVSAQRALTPFLSENTFTIYEATWEDLVTPDATLFITVNSSAASEAAAYGAAVLWAPFLSESSCIQSFMIDDIGVTAKDADDLHRTLDRFISSEEFVKEVRSNDRIRISKYTPQGSACDSLQRFLDGLPPADSLNQEEPF